MWDWLFSKKTKAKHIINIMSSFREKEAKLTVNMAEGVVIGLFFRKYSSVALRRAQIIWLQFSGSKTHKAVCARAGPV